jgi:hypothetical protein
LITYFLDGRSKSFDLLLLLCDGPVAVLAPPVVFEETA